MKEGRTVDIGEIEDGEVREVLRGFLMLAGARMCEVWWV